MTHCKGSAEYPPITVRYDLEQPPTVEELTGVLARLELEPWDITRLGEPLAAGRPRRPELRILRCTTAPAVPGVRQRIVLRVTAADIVESWRS